MAVTITATGPTALRTFAFPDADATILTSHPLVTDLLFTDASYDIGKSGATRPRDGFFSRNVAIGGTLLVTGIPTFSAVPVFSAGVGTITSGVWNAGAITSSGVLTVNGSGAHTFSAGGTGFNALNVRNTTAGTGNGAAFYLGNDTTAYRGALYSTSSTYTPSTYYLADAIVVESSGAGGMSIAAAHASGAIRFYSGGTTQRASFLLGGNFVIGTDLTNFGAVINLGYNPNTQPGMYINATANKAGGEFLAFTNAAQAVQGNITATNSTTTAYNTSSDVRLKTDRGLAVDLTGLHAVKIHDFIWTESGIPSRGVFAQEAVTVFPAAITIGDDSLTPTNKLAKPWMADYSKFVPDLIVGWQDHEDRLAKL